MTFKKKNQDYDITITKDIDIFVAVSSYTASSCQYANVVISCISYSISIKFVSIPSLLMVEISFSPSDCSSILPLVVNIKIGSFKVYFVGQSVLYDFDIKWKG